jgi:putative heme-binding domain-containing protein
VADPRGLQIDWQKLSSAGLAKLLGDPRPVVARRAIAVLAAGGSDALPALATVINKDSSVSARRHALWAACRIDNVAARSLVRDGLSDPEDTVRQVALHAVGLWRDREAIPALEGLLQEGTPHNQRAAAEALGRIGDPKMALALLSACAKPADRALEHSRIYALIECGNPREVSFGLTANEPSVRQATLIALDQMGAIKLDMMRDELASKNRQLKETAWWIAARHPEWGAELAGVLKERFAASLTPPEREELTGLLARFAKAAPVQQFLAARLVDTAAPVELRQFVLRAMARSALRDPPPTWLSGLCSVLRGDQSELVTEAVATARAVNLGRNAGDVPQALLEVARRNSMPAGVRLNALAALPGNLRDVTPEMFQLLITHLTPEHHVAERSAAAYVLSRAELSKEQLNSLTYSLKTAGPLELDRVLDAYARSSDDDIGTKLVQALRSAPGRSNLRAESLRPRLAKFGPAVTKEAEHLYAALEQDSADQRALLDSLLTSSSGGDIRRGQAVFNSAKAACFSCHAIGYIGGNVGPDLTRIGKIRSERDLLESIVFPSASLVRSYEPVAVTTKAGKVYNGLVRRDSPEELVLALSGTEEVRLSRSDIEDVHASKVSIMPAGLEKQLSKQELADLVTFLKACQ